MSALAINPELLRNTRIQLRRGRMLAVVVICAAVSLTFVAYYNLSGTLGGQNLFQTIFLIQTAVLVIGGGIYCLQSVQREKDLNTFDFQRITRLTPFELAVGKVFGAPSLTYFVVLCLMPVALWAAVLGGTRVSTILKMYAILLVGAAAYHCFAVLISMVLDRGTSAGAMLFFLVLVGMTSNDFGASYYGGPLALRAISPFWAVELISPGTRYMPPVVDPAYAIGPESDIFFGRFVSHPAVLIVLYTTLTAWFLLAVVRNIKRDPSVYEIYRPAQGIALALYLNFLVLCFFRWVQGSYRQEGPRPESGAWEFRPISAAQAEGTFLAISLAIFVFLGLALLRNRDRVRRHLREFGGTSTGWWSAMWPAPFLVGGIALAGAAIIGMIRYKLAEQPEWSVGLGVLQVAVLAAWLARDFLYLQWMQLRPARRPLVTAVLYLTIYYVCAGVLLGALGLFDDESSSVAAIFVPSAVFGLDAPALAAHRPQWIGALALVFGQAFVFAWLQRRELQKLAAISPATEPAV